MMLMIKFKLMLENFLESTIPVLEGTMCALGCKGTNVQKTTANCQNLTVGSNKPVLALTFQINRDEDDRLVRFEIKNYNKNCVCTKYGCLRVQ
jgi:hypothetical protein